MIVLSELDFYQLLDADSTEAHTFTTYLGYWGCLAEHIQETYGGDPLPALLAELRSRKAYRSLSGQGKPKDSKGVRTALLNGWASELRLHLIDLEDVERLTIANHGAPIDAYFASSRHAIAWLTCRDSNPPSSHRALLNAISNQVTESPLLPFPWHLHCTALYPRPIYVGFSSPPGSCHNLSRTASPDDRAAMLLRTTRERGVDRRVEKFKQKNKLKRAPRGHRKCQDEELSATTTFDFAWRMRVRSNYDDPAMFYVGSLGHPRARAYAAAIRTWTSTTMFVFEALIAQRARAVLEDAAVHFISRDRSELAEALIVPRLKTLGLLRSQRARRLVPHSTGLLEQ